MMTAIELLSARFFDGISYPVGAKLRVSAALATELIFQKLARPVNSENISLNQVPELEPLDWYPDRFLNGDARYLYGHSSSNALDFVRLTKSDRTRVVVSNPFGVSAPRVLRSIFTTSVPGLIFAVVGETSQTAASMVVWRSTDYGNTWSAVLTLGSAGGETINGVWVLSDRNFCEGTRGWYIGEYNVNSSRVSGGANDGVTLWKSTDAGATWSANQRWNVSGSHQMRHIHALKRMPGGKVLILAGDTDVESAMILWDEDVSIGNVAYSLLPVPVLHGSQRNRAVDVDVFDDNYIYYMGDGTTDDTGAVSDVGWFRAPLSLGEPATRLDGKISVYAKRAIYYSVKFSTGAAAYIEEIGGTVTSEFNLGIWVSNAEKSRIERAGCIKLSTASTGAVTPHMFQVGDTVYVSFATTVLGKGAAVGTAAFTVSTSKTWNGVHPDTVHPVYWVSPTTGVDNADANRGFYPSLPWASWKYALESNRVTQGGRVMLAEGNFDDDFASAVAVNVDQSNAETTDYVTLDGSGMNRCKYSLKAGTSIAQTISLGAEQVRLRVKDVHLSTKRDVSTQVIISGAGATTPQTLQFVRARIGGRDLATAGITSLCINTNVAAGGSISITAYDSEFVAKTIGSAYLFTGDADGPLNFTGARCVFDGGRGAFNPAAGDVISVSDSLFTNYTVAAIRAAATATVVPTTINCRFHSFVGLPQWIDDGGLTENGQWKNARCTNALSPSAIFDSASKVDAQAAPRDPRNFDYIRVAPE